MPSKEFLKGKQQITLYPTEKQHKEIWEKARALGMGLSEYILFVALNANINVEVEKHQAHCLICGAGCNTVTELAQHTYDKHRESMPAEWLPYIKVERK